MQADGSDEEIRLRRQERWERAITVSILAVVGSGILAIAAQDVFFGRPMRSRAGSSACASNLRALDGAKATWALENNRDTNAIPTDADLFGPTFYLREKPACPVGGTYTLGPVGQQPRCSIPGHTI